MLKKYKKNANKIGNNLDVSLLKSVVEIIHSKFNSKLVNYNFEQDIKKIKKGDIVKYIDLFIEKIKTGCVVEIKCDEKGDILIIKLKNNDGNKIWNINPNKYYFFVRINEKKSILRKAIDNYLKKIKYDIEL